MCGGRCTFLLPGSVLKEVRHRPPAGACFAAEWGNHIALSVTVTYVVTLCQVQGIHINYLYAYIENKPASLYSDVIVLVLYCPVIAPNVTKQFTKYINYTS